MCDCFLKGVCYVQKIKLLAVVVRWNSEQKIIEKTNKRSRIRSQPFKKIEIVPEVAQEVKFMKQGSGLYQGCQIFLETIYQNGENVTNCQYLPI
jgi:hypothetical protein